MNIFQNTKLEILQGRNNLLISFPTFIRRCSVISTDTHHTAPVNFLQLSTTEKLWNLTTDMIYRIMKVELTGLALFGTTLITEYGFLYQNWHYAD
jgi:hypothetical protein